MKFPGGASVTLRLTLLFAVVSSLVLLSLGLVVGHLVDGHFEEMDQDLLSGKLELVRDALAEVATEDDLKALPARLDSMLVGHRGLAVRVRSGDGRILYASANAAVLPSPADFPKLARPTRLAGRDGSALRVWSGPAPLALPGVPPATVEVATSLAHHQSFTAAFHEALWMCVALAALLSALLGWGVSRKGLAPLHEISRNAARITAHRLDRRLPVESIPVELAEVARTLNEMLARLEESFHRLSDFSSDLAHELRTPVSNLLTQTQVTLSRARTAGEYREVLESNTEEFERLARTISDMLFLAKAENGLIVPKLEQVDLRAEADSLLEYYGTLLEERGIRLGVEGQASVMGDRLMLRRGLGNLISNAFRHAPRDGSVTVRVGVRQEGVATVAVENTGETIPAAQLPRVFDRFYRADSSRRHDGEGAGLGLAITRSILLAHGGDASARSAEGVTVFELRLPV